MRWPQLSFGAFADGYSHRQIMQSILIWNLSDVAKRAMGHELPESTYSFAGFSGDCRGALGVLNMLPKMLWGLREDDLLRLVPAMVFALRGRCSW